MPSIDSDLVQPITAVKPNPRNDTSMFKIFQNVQYNIVQHKKYVKEMTKLFKKLEEDRFRESFKNALMYLFTFGDTSANVDRVIQFVATFCITLDDEDFLLFIFDIIFDCQCVSGQSVRYRASQLLAAVLAALGDDASLDDGLCDKLLASQMERLQDTRGAVRCRAALALQRLQNPLESDDDVTRAYRFHMSCDPSSSVRRAVVMSIAKCSRNVPFVLERLCDVDEAVRRAAFLYIAAMNVTQLRVKQRVLTLKIGLTEKSSRVRRVVEEILIPGWLSSFEGNIITLLRAIRLDNAQDSKDSRYVAEKLLESLFKRLPISELLEWLPTDKTLRLIPAEKLNKETAWYWRHLSEYLHKQDNDEILETILPDLIVLTGYIRAIVESPCPTESEDPVMFSTRQYVLHELASMLGVYDVADPASRTALQALITDVLTGDYGPLNSDIIYALVSALEFVVPDISRRIEIVSGIISELRDPEDVNIPETIPPPVDTDEAKLKKAKLRVSLNVAMEAQEEAVRDQDYELAAECKAKVEDIQKQLEELNRKPVTPPQHIHTIKEKVSDAETLIKCLTILNSVMDTPQLKNITPMLNLVFNELEVEIFQNQEILETALETVALYGMLDINFAKENKPFFFANIVDISNESLVSTVLKCIFDLLCVHGIKLFDDATTNAKSNDSTTINSIRKRNTREYIDDDDGDISETALGLSPNHSSVIELLLKLMETTYVSYRHIIVEGLCRLLHLGHLESPSILSRLLLLWFNPATVDEDMLRQTIGVFFQTFPISVDDAQDQIQKATMPTLRALVNAPSSSPLAEIDQEAVVRFIVSLTRVNHELTDSQGGMASMVCQYIVRRPTDPEVGLACRLLALLSPPRDLRLANALANMLRDLNEKLPDKQSCRNLTRYLGALEASQRASLNKISNSGITEGTMQEDTLMLGRPTTSLAAPIGRSTHVIVNETIEEEVENNDSSSRERISRISEVTSEAGSKSSKFSSKTSEVDIEAPNSGPSNISPSSSSGVSPVKKAKLSNKGRKKKPVTKVSNETEIEKPKGGKVKATKVNQKTEDQSKGVKRSRLQRSLDDDKTAQKTISSKTKAKNQTDKRPSSPQEVDESDVTSQRSSSLSVQSSSNGQSNSSEKNRKSDGKISCGSRSSDSSNRSSAGSSRSSLLQDSNDETVLHTIVYDKEFVPELLNDLTARRGSVTIPETPDASDESDPESEPIVTKGKRDGKKK